MAELLPSVLAALSVPGEANRLGLDPVSQACVFVIDALGLDLLRSHADRAPFLSGLLSRGRELTAGFPSTTAVSLGSIGTGLAPGSHGLLGYQIAIPGDSRLLNLLKWDAPVVPEQWQPQQTAFERAQAAGVVVTAVCPEAFRDGGLTRAVLRGSYFLAAEAPEERALRAVDGLKAARPALVYVYFGDVDRAGHVSGCGSDQQLAQLAISDGLAARIAEGLPDNGVLYITGDHGMLDIPRDRRIDADRTVELREGVALLGGEARARHVYTINGAAADVVAAWRELLGDRAWVLSRENAVDAGWFGPVAEWAWPRIGDVVAACRDDWAVVATVREPLETSLRAMHGSLTRAELAVPLLEYRP